MSKLDRIRHFLNENKSGLAIVSDPVNVPLRLRKS